MCSLTSSTSGTEAFTPKIPEEYSTKSNHPSYLLCLFTAARLGAHSSQLARVDTLAVLVELPGQGQRRMRQSRLRNPSDQALEE